MTAINAATLRGLLDYDAATGVFRWRVVIPGACYPGMKAGTTDNKGYVCILVRGRKYKAHRLAWMHMHGEWPPFQIDHWNGQRADNRAANLRSATQSQNQGNSRVRRTNASGFKGIYFKPGHAKWCASIRSGGRRRHLGYFDTPEAAHSAYAAASVEVFGEFSRAA